MNKILPGIVCMLLCGCATLGTMDDTRNNAPGRLQSETLNYPIDKVYEAAKLAIFNLGLGLESESKKGDTRIIYAKSSVNMAKVVWFGTGYGEMVGVYITPTPDNQTEVEVAIQKIYKLDVGYKDYRGLIINQIKSLLNAKRE